MRVCTVKFGETKGEKINNNYYFRKRFADKRKTFRVAYETRT